MQVLGYVSAVTHPVSRQQHPREQEWSVMTGSPVAQPQRSHARANRARILEVAREELGRNPEASLDEIARAAGVARRTFYGHYPNRKTLIEALAEEAGQALAGVFTGAGRRAGEDAALTEESPGKTFPSAKFSQTGRSAWP